jgi:hypothetical protein
MPYTRRPIFCQAQIASPGFGARSGAFASTGGIPMNRSAGSVTKAPPAASAFSTPAMGVAQSKDKAWLTERPAKWLTAPLERGSRAARHRAG